MDSCVNFFSHATIEKIATLCRKVSVAILDFYGDTARLNIQEKSNHTPVTQADMIAHQMLTQGLKDILPLLIISEEDPLSHQHDASDYWLIDPIDGTREFLKQTGEFVILIARIYQHRPVFAMIYAPITHTYWYAIHNKGAYKVADHQIQKLQVRQRNEALTIITANHLDSPRFNTYLAHFPAYNLTSCGSALKFAHIAEGKADLYPKIMSINEWDTACGDLLLQEAGGGVIYRTHLDHPFLYGVRDTMSNPSFIAHGAGFSKEDIAQFFAWMDEDA